MAEPTSPFNPGTLTFISYLTPPATLSASVVGVPSRAVVGAIANEYDTRLNPSLAFTGRGATAQNWADDTVLTSILGRRTGSDAHNLISRSYDSYKERGEPIVSGFDKAFFLENIVAIDIGPGNIKISTAIDMLKTYLSDPKYANDPLNLKQLENRYDLFAKELLSFQGSQNVTASITALYIKKGEEFFLSKNAEAWNRASDIDKEALLVTYYKIGETRLSANIDAAMSKAAEEGREYNFNPTGDGGGQHIVNIAQINQSMQNPLLSGPPRPPRCFPGFTEIVLPEGGTKAISEIRLGDHVLSFDPDADGGRGALVSGVVTRLFENVTQEWLRIDLGRDQDSATGSPLPRRSLIATPGHEMLRLCIAANANREIARHAA